MAQLEAHVRGRITRIVITETRDPEDPAETQLVISVIASDGYSLDGLVGMASDITIAPKQAVMDGVR